MHLSAHITRINPVDTERRDFSSQHVRKLFKRRLARSIATPTRICLNACITGDIDYACSLIQLMLKCLDKRKRRDDVSAIDLLKHIKWILQQERLWTGTEDACVIDQCIQRTNRPCRLRQSLTMCRVGHITSNSDNTRML